MPIIRFIVTIAYASLPTFFSDQETFYVTFVSVVRVSLYETAQRGSTREWGGETNEDRLACS